MAKLVGNMTRAEWRAHLRKLAKTNQSKPVTDEEWTEYTERSQAAYDNFSESPLQASTMPTGMEGL